MGEIKREGSFVLEPGRLDFVRRLPVAILDETSLQHRLFAFGPAAQDTFCDRDYVAIFISRRFVRYRLCEFPERIEVPRSPSTVDPPVCCREWPANDGLPLLFAAVCCTSERGYGARLSCQSQSATKRQLKTFPLAQHRPPKPKVVGSTPAGRTSYRNFRARKNFL